MSLSAAALNDVYTRRPKLFIRAPPCFSFFCVCAPHRATSRVFLFFFFYCSSRGRLISSVTRHRCAEGVGGWSGALEGFGSAFSQGDLPRRRCSCSARYGTPRRHEGAPGRGGRSSRGRSRKQGRSSSGACQSAHIAERRRCTVKGLRPGQVGPTRTR